MPRILLASSVLAAFSASSKNKHLRGVDPSKISHYEGKVDVFRCITNPKLEIPLDAVNDDFCDCPDGSDEPGTAACSHLSGMKFYCKNKQSVSKSIHSSFVGDGICISILSTSSIFVIILCKFQI